MVSEGDTADAVRAINLQGHVYLACEQYEYAIERFREAVHNDREFAPALNNWGLVLEEMGDDEAARDKYERAVDAATPLRKTGFDHRGVAWTYVNWGFNPYRMGKYPEAVEKYEAAIETDGTLAIAYRDWGNALARLGDVAGAIRRYRQAVELDEQLTVAYYDWGEALHGLRSYGEAVRVFERGIETAVDGEARSRGYARLGWALVMLGEYDRATEEYWAGEKARELEAGNVVEPNCPVM